MKKRAWNSLRIVGGLALLGALALFLWEGASWLINGGWPATGPTGEKLPPHIAQVEPPDGSVGFDIIRSFCTNFSFQNGNGMGFRPEERIRFYLDGRNVTDKVDGLITLDFPPSSGSLCYKPGEPLLTGWHTAKVVYRDIKGQRFEYSWRFKVEQ